MTNYKIIANAQRKLHVCLWAEREEDNNNDDYHYNITMLMMTTKQQTGYGIRAYVCMCVSKFLAVNCFSMSLLWSFSYISHMFQTLAST